jgi:hypothetical protein
MVEYECPKCKKKIKRIDAYNYHINRKNSCLIEERKSKQDIVQELRDIIEKLSITVNEQGKEIIKLKTIYRNKISIKKN